MAVKTKAELSCDVCEEETEISISWVRPAGQPTYDLPEKWTTSKHWEVEKERRASAQRKILSDLLGEAEKKRKGPSIEGPSGTWTSSISSAFAELEESHVEREMETYCPKCSTRIENEMNTEEVIQA